MLTAEGNKKMRKAKRAISEKMKISGKRFPTVENEHFSALSESCCNSEQKHRGVNRETFMELATLEKNSSG